MTLADIWAQCSTITTNVALLYRIGVYNRSSVIRICRSTSSLEAIATHCGAAMTGFSNSTNAYWSRTGARGVAPCEEPLSYNITKLNKL